MVSKQPVMFTAAAIKDKSPTTRSLRSPTGSHKGLQTPAWEEGGGLGGGEVSIGPVHGHTLTHT